MERIMFMSTEESIEKFEFTYSELLELLKEAYFNGYATFEIVNAGLEAYNSEGYANWTIGKLKIKENVPQLHAEGDFYH